MDTNNSVKKRRTRKKTVEIDSVEKLNISPKLPSIKSDECEMYSNKDNVDQVKTSFGKLIITETKTSNPMTDEELDEHYSKLFGIKETDKTSKLIMQDDTDVVYEPAKEVSRPDKKKPVAGNSTPNKAIRKHRILQKFVDGIRKEWPSSTDIYCWWCCHSFEGSPVPCPIGYDSIKDVYAVNGIFCGWSCAAAYSIDRYSSITLLQQMKNDMEGEFLEVELAPPRYVLKRFGGYMTIKDFRAISGKKVMVSREKVSYINQDIAEVL